MDFSLRSTMTRCQKFAKPPTITTPLIVRLRTSNKHGTLYISWATSNSLKLRESPRCTEKKTKQGRRQFDPIASSEDKISQRVNQQVHGKTVNCSKGQYTSTLINQASCASDSYFEKLRQNYMKLWVCHVLLCPGSAIKLTRWASGTLKVVRQ